ncbi:DMT family transporter [Sinimarinibacterium sp. CAU 1509]|uniref:DMT family transporter n=1 Tax=Sinimarinibacterium sp. CAU 1509 TaxID=2562283 RepID=UPI0010AB5FB9|nr:DMT family transporter [Sinimarinibacterium sp. CAU 1509]TJY59953.1 DMT family transporter [Sinimarinibacterium sp. CAU 1509]
MSHPHERRALPALVLGAVLIGLAPIFVRTAGVGPSAAAFWRLALALPLLGLLLWRLPQPPAASDTPRPLRWLWLAGVFFAADLALWHQSIRWTSVANATLLANMAPVFVTLAAWRLYGERVSGRYIIGLALALVGAATLMADSLQIGPETAFGDLLGIAAAVFYAGYLLGVSRQRRQFNTLQVMFWTTAAGALLTLPLTLAMGETLWPPDLRAWSLLFGLAVLSHVGGQGLIAYALAHLPASFSSVSLLVQPVAASLFAWVLLSERFGAQQAIGGVVVLSGIVLCRLALLQPVPARPS